MAIRMNAPVRVEVIVPFSDEPIVFECLSLAEQQRLGAIESLIAEERLGAGLATISNEVAARKNYAVRVVRRVTGIDPEPDCAKTGATDKAGTIVGSWADEVWYPAIRALGAQMQLSFAPQRPALGEPEKNG